MKQVERRAWIVIDRNGNSKDFFHYYQSTEWIKEDIRTLEDEMGDGMVEDGEIIEVLN